MLRAFDTLPVGVEPQHRRRCRVEVQSARLLNNKAKRAAALAPSLECVVSEAEPDIRRRFRTLRQTHVPVVPVRSTHQEQPSVSITQRETVEVVADIKSADPVSWSHHTLNCHERGGEMRGEVAERPVRTGRPSVGEQAELAGCLLRDERDRCESRRAVLQRELRRLSVDAGDDAVVVEPSEHVSGVFAVAAGVVSAACGRRPWMYGERRSTVACPRTHSRITEAPEDQIPPKTGYSHQAAVTVDVAEAVQVVGERRDHPTVRRGLSRLQKSRWAVSRQAAETVRLEALPSRSSAKRSAARGEREIRQVAHAARRPRAVLGGEVG
mmetsp:Transcript_88058/g.251275  ORF Transcript_88058/g.251275 Transcript_88058/m.251275 type:complete len:325 (+) Transcript_88058:2497-3471(+)